jgi:hypothetical protein
MVASSIVQDFVRRKHPKNFLKLVQLMVMLAFALFGRRLKVANLFFG